MAPDNRGAKGWILPDCTARQNDSQPNLKYRSGLRGVIPARIAALWMNETFLTRAKLGSPPTSPACTAGKSDTYEIRWLVRTKKKALRGNADERDRAKFAKAQSYMTRLDDLYAVQESAMPEEV